MRFAAIFLLLSLISGCSSILAKKHEGFGHPYYGAKVSVNNAVCITYVGIVYYPPGFLLTAPLGILDITTSVVMDTIFLPADLIITPKKNTAPEVTNSQAYYCRRMP
ncbi:MAG: YceK/YidQ family lipoprotein [Thalassotalea sp.]